MLVQRHNLNGIIVFAYINLHCLLRWHYALLFHPILYKHIVKVAAKLPTTTATIRTLYFRSNLSRINTSTSLFVHVLHSTLCCSCSSLFTPRVMLFLFHSILLHLLCAMTSLRERLSNEENFNLLTHALKDADW